MSFWPSVRACRRRNTHRYMRKRKGTHHMRARTPAWTYARICAGVGVASLCLGRVLRFGHDSLWAGGTSLKVRHTRFMLTRHHNQRHYLTPQLSQFLLAICMMSIVGLLMAIVTSPSSYPRLFIQKPIINSTDTGSKKAAPSLAMASNKLDQTTFDVKTLGAGFIWSYAPSPGWGPRQALGLYLL